MAQGLPGGLAWVRHFAWLLSTFTTRGAWLVIPISQLEKLRSERRSDLSRDEKQLERTGGRCLSLQGCPLWVNLSSELSRHRFGVVSVKKSKPLFCETEM